MGDPAVCNACPVKAACTPGATGRHLHRSLHAAYLDRVRGYHATESYKRAMRKRAVWVEPLFGEAKQWHGLRRFRCRGLAKVTTETLLCAAGQNLKRWLVATGWGRRHAPCGALTVPHRAQWPPRRQAPAGHSPVLSVSHKPAGRAARSPTAAFVNGLSAAVALGRFAGADRPDRACRSAASGPPRGRGRLRRRP